MPSAAISESSVKSERYDAPVLIAGAGPSGLLLSLQLAQQGVRSMLIERNLDTTKWPKMDVTNCRSMELFNRLGISQGLRDLGESNETRALSSNIPH
jgi:FAD-dependent monooxygenase